MKHLTKHFLNNLIGVIYEKTHLAAVSSSMLASGFGSGNFTLQRDSVSL